LTANGRDSLATLPIRDKETVYITNFNTALSNGIAPAGTPTQATQIFIPFSSLGFNIGVQIKVGKHFLRVRNRYKLGIHPNGDI
jgi:hypothetical protein